MSTPNWNVSNAVWATWLGEFIVLETLGILRILGLVTLSETSWHDQIKYAWLVPILFGFLLGLILHISLLIAGHHIALWRAVALGEIVALAAHFLLRTGV